MYLSEYKWIGIDQFHSLFIKYIWNVIHVFISSFRYSAGTVQDLSSSFLLFYLVHLLSESVILAAPTFWDALIVSSAALLVHVMLVVFTTAPGAVPGVPAMLAVLIQFELLPELSLESLVC